MHDTGVTFVGNEKCRLNGVLVVDIYRTSVVGGTRVEGLVGHLADNALKSHMKYAEGYYLFFYVQTKILLTDLRIPLKSHQKKR